MRTLPLLSALSSLSIPYHLVSASLVNTTIDDKFGDAVSGALPTYTPPQLWNQSPGCSVCTITTPEVDVNQVFRGTWHDGYHGSNDSPDFNVSVSFSGIAVYVFNLIAENWQTNLTFYIDGHVVDTFLHVPPPQALAVITYQVPVLSKTQLSNGPHTLDIVAGPEANSSLNLLDYIVYTVDTSETSSSPSTSSPTSTPLTSSTSITSTTAPAASEPVVGTSESHSRIADIVGGAVGGAVAIALALAAIHFLRRRKRTRGRPHLLLDSPEDLYMLPATNGHGGTGSALPADMRGYLSPAPLYPSRLSDALSTVPAQDGEREFPHKHQDFHA